MEELMGSTRVLRCPLICQATKVIDEIQGHLLSKLRVYFNHLIGEIFKSSMGQLASRGRVNSCAHNE
jgi:hypothetical protein